MNLYINTYTNRYIQIHYEPPHQYQPLPPAASPLEPPSDLLQRGGCVSGGSSE